MTVSGISILIPKSIDVSIIGILCDIIIEVEIEVANSLIASLLNKAASNDSSNNSFSIKTLNAVNKALISALPFSP